MNDDYKQIIERAGLPVHVGNILEAYGIITLQDLTEISNDIITAIEVKVREHKFVEQNDLHSRTQQIKFFGMALKNFDSFISNFEFKAFERTKLLRLPDLASSELKAIEEAKKVLKENVQKKADQPGASQTVSTAGRKR